MALSLRHLVRVLGSQRGLTARTDARSSTKHRPPMRIGDIAPSVAVRLKEEMERLAMGFKSFPFHIHIRGHAESHRDKFTIYWATKKEYFASPDREDVVSELYCQVVGLHEDIVLLKVHALPRRKYPGQEFPEFFSESRSWYKQEWRQEYFIVEACPSALWTIMEAHANFDRAVSEVHES